MKHLITILILVVQAALVHAAPARSDHVEVELLAEHTSIQPGRPFQVGLRMTMDDHWHTYWRNPGDSGLATMMSWDLPEGFKAGDFEWPTPSWLEVSGLVSFAYEGEILLIAQITPAASTKAGESVRIAGTASWLECKEACLPGQATVQLILPVKDEAPESDPRTASLFKKAYAQLPAAGEDWSMQAYLTAKTLNLVLTPPDAFEGDPGEITFFPYVAGLLDLATAQSVEKRNGAIHLSAVLSETLSVTPDRLEGVLAARNGWGRAPQASGLLVNTPLSKSAPESTLAALPSDGKQSMNLLAALALGFVGGLILNLMPCVFPVISLKILGFVQHTESNRRHVWHHGLMFAVGVVVSFWILVVILLSLKSAGESIGWGFQLKAPGFVASMACLFFLLALSLFGVFEIGTSLTGVGAKATSNTGFIGSFMSGMLATIVATPCTAPLMGPAIGFTLSQPAWSTMTVFTMVALGMATPYLLLSRFPQWLKVIPRPGPWMETLKQFMGFLLMGFTVYLIWVFTGLQGVDHLARLLTGLLILGLAGWIYGRWGNIARAARTRIIAGVLSVLLLAGGVGTALSEPLKVDWVPYSSETVERLRAEGKPVFIDFTATWCVTCQVNKKVAINTKAVQRRFREEGVTLIKADWTDQNPEITRALASFERSGVPLYVLYGPGKETEPRILPELLTPGILIEALESMRR